MESAELGFGGSSDEVESTAVFSSDLLAEAGPFLSSDEQKAIDDLQDVEWMGRMIRVNKAEPRTGGGGG